MRTFIDFYGCKAVIQPMGSGQSRLTVRTSMGSLVKTKTYNTTRGARVAMGRMSECWKEVIPA